MNELMTVRVQNPPPLHGKSHGWQPPYTDYTGRLMPNPRWVASDSFCLTTDDPAFPFRVIQKNLIECAWIYPNSSNHVQTTFTVESNDKSYIVHNINGKLTCNCTGFSYRKKCSHVEKVKERINAECVAA